MSTPISLTEQAQKQLRLQARRSIGRVSERVHYVLLFSRGHTSEQIAALYQVDERTVCQWLERFRQHGVKGLDDLPRSGRPRLATVAAQTVAKRCLETSPTDTGVQQTLWTRRLLQRHLVERADCELSLPTLTRLIKRLGFVWRRPKLALKQTTHSKPSAKRPSPRHCWLIPRLRASMPTSAICISCQWYAGNGSTRASKPWFRRLATTASRRSLAF